MAPKRPTPPSGSGSDSEYESESDQEQQPKPIQHSLMNPKPQPSQEEEDSDDSGTDYGSASDSDNEPVKHMIVPRTTPASTEVKPMTTDPKKPPTPAPASKAASSSAAKKKKKVSELVEDQEIERTENEKKQNQFQRVFSDKDEVVLLNGLIQFKKKGHNVSNLHIGEFVDFVKDKLNHVNQSQMHNKLQRMKNKYMNKVSKLKPGEDPVISKPHELKCYELSKEIWGKLKEENAVEGSESDGKKRMSQMNEVASPKRKVLKVENSAKVELKEEEYIGSDGLALQFLNASMCFKNYPMPTISPSLEMLMGNKEWEAAAGESKAFRSRVEALDKKWKNVLIDEGKAYLKRVQVVTESTQLALDYLESSDL